MSCYHGPCHHGGHHGYGASYGYGPPPGQAFARRGRRARDLEDYAEDLEEELARVRHDLQELSRAETPEG